MATRNYDWFIENNLDDYSCRWVAVDNEKVLESDVKLESLLKKVKEKHPKSRPFVAKVRNKLLRLPSSISIRE